jgi:RNA polymerase sigma factor (TIGR02999 family)
MGREALSVGEFGSITALLRRHQAGDFAARDELFRRLALRMQPIARRLMGQEPTGHTLQPTALINEAVARLMSQDVLAAAPNRTYLFGAAARAMHQVLTDHARTARAEKRGGQMTRVPLTAETRVAEHVPSFDLIELSDAIEALGAVHERSAHVVTLRYLAGYTVPEIAELLGVAVSTVESDWRFARAWLLRQLTPEENSGTRQGD